jgi:hypothetical protein
MAVDYQFNRYEMCKEGNKGSDLSRVLAALRLQALAPPNYNGIKGSCDGFG